jgi:hypothetical protein
MATIAVEPCYGGCFVLFAILYNYERRKRVFA